METVSSAQSEQLIVLLSQQIEENRADLTSRYLSVLRESLFSSRAEIRPSALKVIAAEEVESLLSFLKQTEPSVAQRGEQLHQAGLAVGAVLRLGQVTRQFLLSHMESGQIAPMLEIVDTYERSVVEGFVQGMDDTYQIERGQLERVLTSLHQRGDGQK